jgi:hypothetical protein
MSESSFQTFQLLAAFNIALISVSIANYAVSASYLGRETQLSRKRMEKRKEELSKKLIELQKGQIQIPKIKEEISKAEKDINRLRNRLLLLSWIGAVIFPSTFFGFSFVVDLVGMNSTFSSLTYNQYMFLSAYMILIGFILLMGVIQVIDFSAKNIPVPKFTVTFENNNKVLKLEKGENSKIRLWIKNEGEDLAENVEVFVQFPPEFTIPAQGHDIFKQQTESDFPNFTVVVLRNQFIHVDVSYIAEIVVQTPADKKSYSIPIVIYERKIGATKKELTIEITD